MRLVKRTRRDRWSVVKFKCCLAFFCWLVPRPCGAQAWEVEAGWSKLDHDPPSWVTREVERIPSFGRILVRRQVRDGRYFLQGELGVGRQTGPSSRSWAALWSLSLGHAFRSFRGRWMYGFRPSLGIGSVRFAESRPWPDSWEHRSVLLAEGTVEMGVQGLFGLPGLISLSAGIGRAEPIFRNTCADCVAVLTDKGLPRYSIGLAISGERK